MIIDQTSKASKESYSTISEQGKDGLCSITGMQHKKSQVQSHADSEATSWYYYCFTQNTDVAYRRKASSSKLQQILIKRIKVLRETKEETEFIFIITKSRGNKYKKESNTLILHYQFSLPLHFSSFQNHSSSSCLTPFCNSLLNHFAVPE